MAFPDLKSNNEPQPLNLFIIRKVEMAGTLFGDESSGAMTGCAGIRYYAQDIPR